MAAMGDSFEICFGFPIQNQRNDNLMRKHCAVDFATI